MRNWVLSVKSLALGLVLCAWLVAQAALAIDTPVLIATNGTASSVNTLSCAVGAGGVPGGATIFAAFSHAEASSAHTATDTAGNSYGIDVTDTNQAASDLEIQLWRSSTGGALVNGDSITFNWTTNVANIRVVCFYVTGLQTSPTPVDQSTTAEGASSTPSSGNITTTTTDQIEIGFTGSGSAATVNTEDANFTTIGAQTTSRGIHAAYRIVSSTETMDYSPSYSASENWTTGIASYKAAAAAANDNRLNMLLGVGN